MATKFAIEKLVTVFGGSGFLGRHVVRALAQRGYRIRVAVRRPALAGYLQPMGRVGQIHAVQANLRYPDSVAAALRDADVAINLVGLMLERGGQRFDAIMTQGAETVAKAASAVGAPLVHVSSLSAEPESASHYARTKGEGEELVRAAQNGAIIVRPSILFGPEDDFFNRFAAMSRLMPLLPLVGGGHTRMQPVFAGDVAEGIAKAVDGELKSGTTYEFGGPGVYSFKALMEILMAEIDVKRFLVPLPWALARFQAGIAEWVPGKPLTRDQVELLKYDNVVSSGHPGLAELGVTPSAVELILPTFLDRFVKGGRLGRQGRTVP